MLIMLLNYIKKSLTMAFAFGMPHNPMNKNWIFP